MARYEHLPIFVDAYKLLLQVGTQVQTFSNRHRPALGADLRALSRRFVELIIAANGRRDERTARLEDLRDAIELFLVFLHAAKDLKALSSLKASTHWDTWCIGITGCCGAAPCVVGAHCWRASRAAR